MLFRLYSSLSALALIALAVGIHLTTTQPVWNATGSLVMARTRHTATLLTDGRVLVVGGLAVANPCCRIASIVELYNPAIGQWRATSSPNTPRYRHIAVRLANGKVLIAGGTSETNSLLASTEIFDPLTETWNSGGNLNVARDDPQAILLPDGRVLITGGGAITTTGLADMAEVYDPEANAWTSAGTMKKGRVLHSIAMLPTGKVLIAGGFADVFLRTSEIYDPSTNTWALTGDLAIPSANRTATLLVNGKVLITGGGECQRVACSRRRAL